MERHEANNQLCKMQGEVADHLELKTICTCGETAEMVGEVPDEVISELWRLIADGRRYRRLRAHAEDLMQNPKSMSGKLKRVAELFPSHWTSEERVIDEAAEHYSENYALVHQLSARVEELEKSVENLHVFVRAVTLFAHDCEMLHYDEIAGICNEVLEGKTDTLKVFEAEWLSSQRKK